MLVAHPQRQPGGPPASSPTRPSPVSPAAPALALHVEMPGRSLPAPLLRPPCPAGSANRRRDQSVADRAARTAHPGEPHRHRQPATHETPAAAPTLRPPTTPRAHHTRNHDRHTRRRIRIDIDIDKAGPYDGQRRIPPLDPAFDLCQLDKGGVLCVNRTTDPAPPPPSRAQRPPPKPGRPCSTSHAPNNEPSGRATDLTVI